MTDQTAIPEQAEQPVRKTGFKFRGSRNAVRPTPDQARRQNTVVQSAWRTFGERDSAMLFLNSHDKQLGGTPLQIAVASDDGLDAVERALAARQASGSPAAT